MSVLRRNKDSLMAVLEAFVYDPLLNWRLMEANIRNNRSTTNEIGSISTSSAEVQDLLESLSITASKKGITSPEGVIDGSQPEAVNRKAVLIINRVRDKLTGKDFTNYDTLTVQKQVDLLIQQATSNENLCQCYIGWCPFW